MKHHNLPDDVALAVARHLDAINHLLSPSKGRATRCLACGTVCTDGCTDRECWSQRMFDQIPTSLIMLMPNDPATVEADR